jgi:hypothetical protein
MRSSLRIEIPRLGRGIHKRCLNPAIKSRGFGEEGAPRSSRGEGLFSLAVRQFFQVGVLGFNYFFFRTSVNFWSISRFFGKDCVIHPYHSNPS